MRLDKMKEYFLSLPEKVKNYKLTRKARCTNEIKEVIRKYEKTGILPDYWHTFVIKGEALTLSVALLVEDYGLTVMDALFLMDSLLQGDEASEEKLYLLLGLKSGYSPLKVDKEYLEAHVDPAVKQMADQL